MSQEDDSMSTTITQKSEPDSRPNPSLLVATGSPAAASSEPISWSVEREAEAPSGGGTPLALPPQAAPPLWASSPPAQDPLQSQKPWVSGGCHSLLYTWPPNTPKHILQALWGSTTEGGPGLCCAHPSPTASEHQPFIT